MQPATVIHARSNKHARELTLAVALALCACGGSSASEQSASEPTSASAPEAATAGTAAPASAAMRGSVSASSAAGSAAPGGTGAAQTASAVRAAAGTSGAPAAAPTRPAANSGTAQSATAGGAAPPPSAGELTAPSGGWPADCESRHVFAAHGAAGTSDHTKYQVKAGTEYHVSFLFRAPWKDQAVQMLRSVGTIDNRTVVHHWNLYAVDDAGVQDGEIRGGAGEVTSVIPGEALVIAGVPGSQPIFDIPDDVGVRMPTGPHLALRFELHYNNPTEQTQPDATQVEICVTSHKRAHEGAAHWLGTFGISLPPHRDTDLVSRCVPNMQSEPVHVMAVMPHMHRLGTHAKLVLSRASGDSLTVHDQAYSFTEQRMYYQPRVGTPGEVIVQPGDSLTTTCSFQNSTDRVVGYGENTEDEMCLMGILAWPLGQLVNGSPLSLLVPGALADVNCLE